MKRSKSNFPKQIGVPGQRRTDVKRRLLVETLCERRVLATITGMVFADADDSWRLDAEEASLAGRLVFVDSNDNGLPDDGEPFALTDFDGSFSLDELGSDDQIVRLFSGAPSQPQHFPVHPELNAGLISLDDYEPASAGSKLRIDPLGGRAVVQAATGLIIADLVGRTAVEVELGASPVASEFLADGRILVLATDEFGNHAFLVDPDGIVQVVDLLSPPSDGGELESGGETIEDFAGWASVAIDTDGHGILIPRTEAESVLARKLVIQGDQVSSIETATGVVPAAKLTGGGAVTTVIAEPFEDGVALSLWSNSTGSVISDQPIGLAGADSVLAYRDTTGLVFGLLPAQGEDSAASIIVLDAAADFAVLQTLTDLDDLLAVDTDRSIVFSLSPEQSRLRAIDALTAETVADWMIQLDLVGEPVEMALHAAGNELVLLGSAGLATIALDRIDAHRVKLDGSVPQYPLRFAVKVIGENEPPMFMESLEFNLVQGNSLAVPVGGLLAVASDPEGDPLVVVRSSAPEHGVAMVTPLGGMTYTPDADFSGTDSFDVFLHDGRGPSSVVTVQITVSPAAPDPEIKLTIFPVPENAEAGFVVGEIETIGFGGGPLVIVIDDPRFQVVDGLIVVVDGAVLDFEEEYLINTQITVSDEQGEISATRTFTVELTNENDSIEDIQPRSATVFENVVGELIAELMVIDQGGENPFILSVDDDRFEIINRNLRLKPGISLDYEAASEVVINITATDAFGGDSLTVPFTIFVTDVAEQAGSIALSNHTVIELVPGATVGDVSVDGNPLRASYVASVDDSRFEIVDGVLKLRDDEYLSFQNQQEAQVIITVQDVGRVYAAVAETFVIVVLENENPFHNPDNAFDVNGDGLVTPLDALLILNVLSQNGGGGPISDFSAPGRFWDVNGDGLITPLDALLILNFINHQNRPPAVSEPESSPSASPQVEPELQLPEISELTENALPLAVAAAPQTQPAAQRDADAASVVAPHLAPQASAATAARLFDRALETLDSRLERRELPAADKLLPSADLERLAQSLRERLTPGDWETLSRWNPSIRSHVLTPEVVARVELALERINRI